MSLALTLTNLNRSSKFLHRWKENRISHKMHLLQHCLGKSTSKLQQSYHRGSTCAASPPNVSHCVAPGERSSWTVCHTRCTCTAGQTGDSCGSEVSGCRHLRTTFHITHTCEGQRISSCPCCRRMTLELAWGHWLRTDRHDDWGYHPCFLHRKRLARVT